MKKIPHCILAFWVMKICAAHARRKGRRPFLDDHASRLCNECSSVDGAVCDRACGSTASQSYHPLLYWVLILLTSTVGTNMSDYLDRTAGLGYAKGSLVLCILLLAIFVFWRFSMPSLSVKRIITLKGEGLYWAAILVSNTLGTALGDFLADESHLGFAGGALLIAGLLGLVILATFCTSISKTFLFWAAFILTRPFGATMGDLLTKTHANGGLGFGTIGSSFVLASLLVLFILFTNRPPKVISIYEVVPVVVPSPTTGTTHPE